jgi:hypothetical protein
MIMDDELITKITELTNAVVANGGTAGLRKEELIADFKELLEAQRAQILADAPVRMGEFQAPEVNQAVEQLKGNRLYREVKDITAHGEHRIGHFRMRGSDLCLAKMLLDKANQMKAAGIPFAGSDKVKPASDDLNAAVKALTATGSGTGDELVPTGMATEMWQDIFAASRLANDIPNQPMPTDPFDITLGFGSRTWRKGTQALATNAADPATAKVTLTSTEQVTEDDWSYNLDEDAVIAMMPALRANLTLTGGQQMDAFTLNADSTATSTGNINLDDSTPAADAYYLTDGQDGIRHQVLVDYTAMSASLGTAITDAAMATVLGRLGKYGLNPTECRIVPDVATYLTMLGLTNIATMEKYGPLATIVTGELGKYRGIPVIPSGEFPLTEADGKCSVTAASNTKGTVIAYNRNFWRVGFRRGLTIEVDRLIQRRVLIMVTSFRIAVAAWGTRSAVTHTSGEYNLTV